MDLSDVLPFISERAGIELVKAVRFPGGINTTTLVTTRDDRTFVLKLGRRGRAKTLLKEAVLLGELQGYIPVPQVTWVSDKEFTAFSGAVLMEHLPLGCAITVAPDLPLSFFVSVGQMLARIHSDTVVTRRIAAYLHTLNESRAVSYPFKQKFSRACILVERIAERNSTLVPILKTLLARMKALEVFFDSVGCALTHNDLSLNNILTDGSNTSAFIDFEEAMPGDPACDLSFFCQSSIVSGVRASMVGAFLAAYKCLRALPMGFLERAAFYRYFRAFERVASQVERSVEVPEETDRPRSSFNELLERLVHQTDECLSESSYGVQWR